MKRTCSIVLLASVSAAGCETEDPTQVVVDNDYPVLAAADRSMDGGGLAAEMTVFKVWWSTTLLPDAVAPGSEGQPQRTVPGAQFAYALLAPGWDPSSATAPERFLAAKSVSPLTIDRGDTLHVRVSDATFAGNCAAGKPLSQEDADLVTQRIFPDEFAGISYDAPTCAATTSADGAQPDSGVDAEGLGTEATTSPDGSGPVED